MQRRYIILVVLLIISSLGINAQELVILHTNDTHSQIMPQTTGKGNGFGGYERREEYIKSVRANNKNVILLDAGDFSQGSPYFTLFKGDVEIELMNALGYDAATIGNHELDNGPAELARRIKNAKFPIITANYNFSSDNALAEVVKPYTIIERDGVKVGIIGITTALKGLVSPKHSEGMEYLHPYKVMNKLALDLKNNKKCDIVILLTHVGYEKGREQNPTDEMLGENSENIDIIVGGHSHTFIKKPRVVKNKLGKKVTIVTAGEKGDIVGRLDIKL